MPVTESVLALAPQQIRFTVPATLASVRVARRKATAVLDQWKIPVDVDTAVLLLSEVVSNALQHGVRADSDDDAQIDVELAETPIGLCVTVHDPDDGEGGDVTIRHASTQSERGRGLELVQELSVSWGCTKTLDGKCVHFIIAAVEQSPDGGCPKVGDACTTSAVQPLTCGGSERIGAAS